MGLTFKDQDWLVLTPPTHGSRWFPGSVLYRAQSKQAALAHAPRFGIDQVVIARITDVQMWTRPGGPMRRFRSRRP